MTWLEKKRNYYFYNLYNYNFHKWQYNMFYIMYICISVIKRNTIILQAYIEYEFTCFDEYFGRSFRIKLVNRPIVMKIHHRSLTNAIGR